MLWLGYIKYFLLLMPGTTIFLYCKDFVYPRLLLPPFLAPWLEHQSLGTLVVAEKKALLELIIIHTFVVHYSIGNLFSAPPILSLYGHLISMLGDISFPPTTQMKLL